MASAESSPAGTAAPSPSADAAVGDLIAGKYQLEKLLGEGGMGRVFLARHALTKKLVALKFLRAELSSINDSAGRFMNEARAAVRMESEHVARVIDVDVLPSGVPYMVLEYLEGEDLATIGRRRERLPPHVAVDYVLEACVAVAEAHAMGIIHRDLKPANLFLTRRKDGTDIVKVLDFGLAKVLEPLDGDPEYAATRAGDILGSPPFMSPEQLTTPESLDVRTDIWSLGVVLYKLIAGHVPFRGKPASVRVIQIVQLPHEPLVRIVPDLSPELSSAVDRCLAKDPADRFPNVAALADALASSGTRVGQAAADKVRRLLAASSRPLLASATDLETLPRTPSNLLLPSAPPPAPPPPASLPPPSPAPVADALPVASDTTPSPELPLDAAANEDAPTATLWSSSNHPLDVPPELRRSSGSTAMLIALALGAAALVVLVGFASAMREAPRDTTNAATSTERPAASATPLSLPESAPPSDPPLPSAAVPIPPAPTASASSKRQAASVGVGGPPGPSLPVRDLPKPKKGVWGGQH